MKKQTKTLIILLVVLVIIGGGLAAVKLLNKEPEAAPEETAEEAYTALFSAAPEEITELTYTYQGETVSLVKNGETWNLADDPDYPLNPEIIDAMTAALAEVKLYKQIDSAEDFGFASDGIEVTVKAAEKYHFALGMKNTQIDKAYLLTDTSKIYTTATDLRSAFEYTAEELLLADSMPEINASAVTEMSVSGADGSYTIYLSEEQVTYYPYRHMMENAQGITPIDSTKVQSFLQVAASPALICVDPAPDPQTVTEAGFVHVSGEDANEGPAAVEFIYQTETADGQEKEENYRFYLGNKMTDEASGLDYRYLMLEDSDMLFRIMEKSASRILTPNLEDLVPEELCMMNFSQITEFAFRLKDESHKAIRTKEGEEKFCYLDGNEINYGYVESFFLDLVQIPMEGIYTEELPAAEPVVSADFILEFNGINEGYHLDIYEYNANFCIASFSGRQETLLVSTRDVDALTGSLAELNTNAAR